jgi:hypothetical protein
MNAFTSNRWRCFSQQSMYGVVDDVQMLTTVIILDPWLLQHFILSTNIDTPDQKSMYLNSFKLEF